MFSVNAVTSSREDALRKPTMDDLIAERHKYVSCRILMNQVNYNDGPYSIDCIGVLSRRSRLDDAVLYIAPVAFRQAALYHVQDPILLGTL